MSWDANHLLSGEYSGSFYFDDPSKNDRVESIFHDKGGDGGRTFIIDGEGCNEFRHYIVNGEFGPRHSTASMQRQFYCHSTIALHQQQLRLAAQISCRKAMLQRLEVFLMKITLWRN